MKAMGIAKGRHPVSTLGLPLAASCLVLGLSGCLIVGYSSRGGAFIWPGGIGFIIMLLILFFLLRARR